MIIEYQKKVPFEWQYERCEKEEAEFYIVEVPDKGGRRFKRLAISKHQV